MNPNQNYLNSIYQKFSAFPKKKQAQEKQDSLFQHNGNTANPFAINNQGQKEKAQIVYENDVAKTDLGIQCRSVKEILNNFSN